MQKILEEHTGYGNKNKLVIIISNIIIIGIMIKFLISKIEDLDKKILYSLSLIISGGTSNLIDRIFRGYVIDYIDINQLIKLPMFNIADIFIVLGIIVLIISIAINSLKNRRNKWKNI